ncbi:MAG TPA: hypothetical protein PLU87_11090 [Sedimentisphaerales bacterium]|nr:hypothetical protein [Sedimentisphaerales bacterium]HRS11589.1 hypothetical protein [Sedimentisphaerales bacterium]HRV48252.1 hypothetical protein [Sedimentisphaerales bacterium]
MKKILFIAVVLLLMSAISFGSENSHYGKSSGGTQTQIAFTGVVQSTSAYGSGASFGQFASGSAYANQQMYSPKGAMSQTANPSVKGGSVGTTGWWGAVCSWWGGLSLTYQTQSLPSR